MNDRPRTAQLRRIAMSAEHTRSLRSNRVHLIKDMLPKEVMDYLIADDIFTADESDSVAAEKNNSDKTRCLLDTLQRKSDAGYKCLIKALNETGQGYIAEYLEASPGKVERTTPTNCLQISLGIGIFGGRVKTLLKRNIGLPTSATQTISGMGDAAVNTVDIYAGERPMARHNVLLGTVNFKMKSHTLQAKYQYNVGMHVSEGAVLTVAVSGEDVDEQSATFAYMEALRQGDIQRMIAEAELYKVTDRDELERQPSLRMFVACVNNTLADMKRGKYKGVLTKTEEDDLVAKCKVELEWLSDANHASKQTIDERRRAFEELRDLKYREKKLDD